MQARRDTSRRADEVRGNAGEPLDPEERVRAAMWLFRSSVNRKKVLAGAGDAGQAGEGRKEASLRPLWLLASDFADGFSHRFIAARFN